MSKRIPELPLLAIAGGNMRLAIWNDVDDLTYGVLASTLIPEVDDVASLSYDPDAIYNEDDVALSEDKFWICLVDGTQGVTPVEGATWHQVNRSAIGLVLWQAGLFTSSQSTVLYDNGIYTGLYVLNTAAPFNSTNFASELMGGKWKYVGQPGGGGGSPGGASTNVQYNNGGAFAGTNDFTYNGNQLLVRSGTNTALLLATTIVGSGYATSSDPMVVIERTTDATINDSSHGFSDRTIFKRNTNGLSNNAFEDIGKTGGTANYEHHAAFQSGFVHESTGTLNNMLGYTDSPATSGGVVNTRIGLYINDVGGAGTVNNNYGLFINPLSRGAVNNYGIYNAANTLLGGNVEFGSPILTSMTVNGVIYSRSQTVIGTVSDRKMYLTGDFGGSGELPAGAYIANEAGGGMTIMTTPTGAATSKLALVYYNGTSFKSALEFMNQVGGIPADMLLMKSGGSVVIGSSAANSSALLKLDATDRGFLMPRMTGAQAEAIVTPAEGLLIYCNNGNGVTINSKGHWSYDGATWNKL